MAFELKEAGGTELKPLPDERLDPTFDWNSTEGRPFSVIAQVEEAIKAREKDAEDDPLSSFVLRLGDGLDAISVAPASVVYRNADEEDEAQDSFISVRPADLPEDAFQKQVNPDNRSAKELADRQSLFPLPLRASSIRSGDQEQVLDMARAVGAHSLHPGAEPEKMRISAVIDTAINMANSRFRCPDASGNLTAARVDYGWIQPAPTGPAVLFGNEVRRSDIEAAIAAHGDDEILLMETLGIIPSVYADFVAARRAASHGTHVMDLAAGYAPDEAAGAKDHRIIAVQIPDIVTADTSGQSLFGFSLTGLFYVLMRAAAMSIAAGRAIPLAVNFSYGLGAGAHDGSNRIERAMRLLLRSYIDLMHTQFGIAKDDVPVRLVLPSGNRRVAQGHAQVIKPDDAVQPLTLAMPWHIQPDDPTSNIMEFWVADNATLDELRLRPPFAATELVLPGPLAMGSRWNIVKDGGVIGRITVDSPSVMLPDTPPCRSKRVHIAMAGTRARHGVPVAPAGPWGLSLRCTGLSKGQDISAWVERDNEPLGLETGARPSFFEDADYVRHRRLDNGEVRISDPGTASPIRREGTISGIATRPTAGPEEDFICIVGGKYGQFDPGINLQANEATYSGMGDSGAGGQTCPISDTDALLTTDRSQVRLGVFAAGTISGSTRALSGTSTAAPQAARILLDQMAAGGAVGV